ncbi:MAG: crotonase/enoyl-CoA hydratase family protein [Myxococcota bacterium]
MTDRPRVRIDREGAIHVLSLDRAEKRNAFDLRMLSELAAALTAFEDDPDARVAVLCADGEHFTAGLDLAEVGPAVASGAPLFPEGSVDPLGLNGRTRTKPLVMAVQGWCLTIGIELLLAADIRIAADDSRFGQIEINRGIFPFGGATIRLPQVAGWGNAMRWLLTGDVFDAAEAHRIGLVQEVVEPGFQREAALSIARTIASRAPLGVRATLLSSATTLREGPDAAAELLLVQARELMRTRDALEGMQSFLERRDAVFRGE